jgi:tight adherence protein C
MTGAFLAGGLAGLGLFLLGLAWHPPRPRLSQQLAAFDASRQAASGQWQPGGQRPAGQGPGSGLRWRLGQRLARISAGHGLEFSSARANLALAGLPFEVFLATKVLLAAGGLVLGALLAGAAGLAGLRLPAVLPAWLSVLAAVAFFFLPDLEARQRAEQRRRDFRHAIGAFLDLVALNLAGGRGVPEALIAASEVGTGWSFWRIKDALVTARITGQAPWQALGALGEEVRIAELRDLAAALSLVAEDGAKVRESLVARAASLRQRELADLQGQAGERSQSMLVAQLLLCAGFLLFLIFPLVGVLLSG